MSFQSFLKIVIFPHKAKILVHVVLLGIGIPCFKLEKKKSTEVRCACTKKKWFLTVCLSLLRAGVHISLAELFSHLFLRATSSYFFEAKCYPSERDRQALMPWKVISHSHRIYQSEMFLKGL